MLRCPFSSIDGFPVRDEITNLEKLREGPSSLSLISYRRISKYTRRRNIYFPPLKPLKNDVSPI